MNKLFWFTLFLYFSTVVFAQDKSKYLDDRYVIFRVSDNVNLNIVEIKDTSEIWVPSLQLVDRGIKCLLSSDSSRTLTQLYAQIIGVRRDSINYIFYNFFCRAESHWKHEVVWVVGGGNCYFQYYYDVSKNSIFQYQENAPK